MFEILLQAIVTPDDKVSEKIIKLGKFSIKQQK
jgi:hypothetical protein